MDFEITPEHQQLVDSVRAVLEHECPTTLVRDIVEDGSTPEQPWKSAYEFGLTSIDLPESLGGLELGFTAINQRAARVYRATISAGTSEIQRNIIAQRVLGSPRR